MSEIAKAVGQRIRNYRTRAGFSQEKLAEMSGCHPTYIGQLERGEKNATIESIEKIATALSLPMSKLFEQLGGQDDGSRNIPLECYEFLSAKTPDEQEQLFKILLEMDKYKAIGSPTRKGKQEVGTAVLVVEFVLLYSRHCWWLCNSTLFPCNINRR